MTATATPLQPAPTAAPPPPDRPVLASELPGFDPDSLQTLMFSLACRSGLQWGNLANDCRVEASPALPGQPRQRVATVHLRTGTPLPTEDLRQALIERIREKISPATANMVKGCGLADARQRLETARADLAKAESDIAAVESARQSVDVMSEGAGEKLVSAARTEADARRRQEIAAALAKEIPAKIRAHADSVRAAAEARASAAAAEMLQEVLTIRDDLRRAISSAVADEFSRLAFVQASADLLMDAGRLARAVAAELTPSA